MTNKPMLSVERELLEKWASGWIKAEHHAEMRAILDKPDTPYTPKGEWSFEYIDGGDIVIRNGEDWTLIKRGDGPIYEQFLYRFCEEQLNKPAAQHQVEPVAWKNFDGEGGFDFTEDKETAERWRISNGCFTDWLIPLYAEQPAPLAGQTQCEECKGWGYHENHHEGGGTECGECGGSGKAPVAVAVVMPDRQADPGPVAGLTRKWAEGWNDALDAVARLNGVRP